MGYCDPGRLSGSNEHYGESGMRAFLSEKVLLFLWVSVRHMRRGMGRLDPPRKVFDLYMHFCT